MKPHGLAWIVLTDDSCGRARVIVDCREMFARLSEYLDGELPPNLCQELARHLEGCAPCKGFSRTLRLTVDLCRQLPPKPLPEAVRRELRALLIRGHGA